MGSSCALLGSVGWVCVPKCALCLTAYVAAVTGVSVPFAQGLWLRVALLFGTAGLFLLGLRWMKCRPVAKVCVLLALVCAGSSGAAEGGSSKKLADGKHWTTQNLNVRIPASYCYAGVEANCRKYGRLYTWESARKGCQALGAGWRLPANEEWQQMAKHYGGVREDAADGGKAAYQALLNGGRSGFNAEFGGTHNPDGTYARLDAHAFYWTASESDPGHAWFYNLGRGGLILNRHGDGEKERGLSVRCVKD